MLFVFDLDGTLVDSAEDLANAMNATRRFAGMPELDPQLIYAYVGNGVPMLVKRALGPEASEETNRHALQFFLQFYSEHAVDHTRPYEGIREMMDQLAQAGHQQAVLTNKPEQVSVHILRALKLDGHLFRIIGGDTLGVKKPDPAGLQQLIESANASASNTWIVGDSGVDIRTGRNAGVRSCGVSWGFQPEGMRAENPDVIVQTPDELVGLALSSSASPLRVRP